MRMVAAAAATMLLAGCAGSAPGPVAEPEVGAPRAEVVEFTTSDGVRLSGFQFGSGDTAVVLAHMRNSNKDAWVDAAAALARNGFVALTFDFRGYAGQEGTPDTKPDVDVAAALEQMRNQGAQRVFVVGASMGGTAAVAVAAEEELDGVVAVSAPAEFAGIDALAAAARVEEPALFMAAEDDQPYAADAAELSGAAGGGLVLYDGDAHGTDLLDGHREQLIAAIIRFVKDPEAAD